MSRRSANVLAWAAGAALAAAALAHAQSPADQQFRGALVSLSQQKFVEAEIAFAQSGGGGARQYPRLVGIVEVYLAQGKQDEAQRLPRPASPRRRQAPNCWFSPATRRCA